MAALPFILSAILVFSQGCASSRDRGTYHIRAQIREVVEAPMLFVNGVPFVQAHVNGAGPFWFILDTGAEIDVVHSRLARLLGLQKVSAFWLNQTVEGDWCDGIDLTIGASRYLPERVASTALNDIESVFGQQIDGILGQYFFRCFVVELDYPRQVLRLHPTSRRLSGESMAVPITFHGFRPTIEATVELTCRPAVGGFFFVDTGSGFELKLGSRLLEAHEIEEPLGSVPSRSMMLHGESDALSAPAVSLNVGSVSVIGPLVTIGGHSGLDYERSIDGTIGGPFLRRFHVILDYPREKMWIEEPSR